VVSAVSLNQSFFSHSSNSSSVENPTPILEVKNVTKRFPGVTALENVSFRVFSRTIHALLGENGAGKSTLVKILCGIYTPDEGEVYVNGVKAHISCPRDAAKYGIVMVSQSPVLIERLTIAENLILSLKSYSMLTSTRRVYRDISDALSRVGLNIDPNTEVYKLTYTQKQLVEIARALLLGARILILDEATTYLPEIEKKRMFKFLREYADAGNAVVLITHKLVEALEVSDEITVLRRGRVVATVKRREATLDLVRKLMFGESEYAESSLKMASKVSNEHVLSFKDLWVRGDLGDFRVRGVSLDIRRGEIVGIAGITGNGQVELLEAIVGLRRVERGEILINGVNVTNKPTHIVRKMGVGFIPDNPLRYGLSVEHTIAENIALSPQYDMPLIPWNKVNKFSQEVVSKYGIVTPSINTPVKLLSGGNLMKTLVARELEYASTLLVAYNPTRGLDEYTTHKVRRMIFEKTREKGLSVLFASEDLDEVLQLSDRVVVMNAGRFVGVFRRDEVVRDKIEELMVA